MGRYFETDDLRQTVIVLKNEMIKTMRAKKAMLYIVLVIAVLALQTFLPYIIGDGLEGNAGSIFGGYISFVSLIIMLSATLFGSYAIVSEFEERTALIMFTRPIRKSAIFFGKFLSCYLIGAVVTVFYYLVSVLVAYAVTGDMVSSFGASLGVSLSYLFACTGVAMVISSFFKKGGTCAVMTFITILLFISLISGIINTAGMDAWFMMDRASMAITNSIPEYVENLNAMMESIGNSLGIDMSDMMTEVADAFKDGCVLVGWGIVTTILSFIMFLRKEF